ncbi:manganese efflux pump MntP family protein [Sporosarcina contaminans]|uniref:Manganese efflux pump MntP family protein n=1 Tax=Sporosarcina contaminans TaxID=633403 RepID=A0ABW3TVW8_9BACL
MQLLSIILIGIAANLDNLGISVAYGLKSNRIPIIYNSIISLISMLCAFVSIQLGNFLSHYLTNSAANMIGGILLIGLGVSLIIASLRTLKKEQPQSIAEVKDITLKESILLGFILSFNCLTIGFSAGITGVSALFASISIGIFSFLSVLIGTWIGYRIGNSLFGKYTDIFAGALLIFIGVYEIFI